MTTPPPPPPPVPKPRNRYLRDSLSSALSLDRDLTDETLQPVVTNAVHQSTDEDAPNLGLDHGVVFPTLAGVTDIIAVNIPSLAGIASAIGGSAPPAATAPSAPPSIDSMANSIATHIPTLTGTASSVASPAAMLTHSWSTPGPAAGLDSIISSLSNIPSLTMIIRDGPPPPFADEPYTPSLQTMGMTGDPATDVEALLQLVRSIDGGASVTHPPAEGAADPAFLQTLREENPYVTVLACWGGEEEADSELSNEDEDTEVSSAPLKANDPMEGDPPSNPPTTNNVPTSCITPTRPAPPPPRPSGQSQNPGKQVKQKTPRAATIRVSRKKGGSGNSAPRSAVVRSSWLDVWKGFRYNVLWATFDGQLMSLWKKRTDRFSEVLFHVSSITKVKQLDKGRFSVHFRKKHYDFMAHSDEVQDGWVTSLLDSRGQPSPTSLGMHGQITIKDPRSRVYAAVWGQDLWIYPNKEGYQLGIASFSVPLNVATIKSTGKHSFTLITPFRSFNVSVDSTKDASLWLDSLSSSIRSALSSSQVATRLWENAHNKLCADCGLANPEWASVNLLLVICENCAGQHRGLGSKLSKVRSLKMDNKIWTEPLMQLFVTYGNQLANEVWAAAVPAAEQLHPDSSDEERSTFIQDKYSRGRYRRVHALASSPTMMDQRLCEVACTSDVQEMMSLICSGAKVCHPDPQSPSPILLAERAGQALQVELLRLNEYTEFPSPQLQAASEGPGSTPSGEEEEELHGKLEEDRFLFSLENESAACDVLDLREVQALFVSRTASQFEMVTLSDQLTCAADDKEALLTHLVHILKVILPGGVSYAEVCGASAVSKVSVVEMGGALHHSDAWLLLGEDGVSIHPVERRSQQTLRMELSMLSHHEISPSENIISMVTGHRCVSLRFQQQYTCRCWYDHLLRALANHSSLPCQPPAANHSSAHQSLYPVMDVISRGSVPPGIERCISHITAHGLKVEGVYRRCGLATKVNQLAEALVTSPSSAPLESHEQGVLDAASALKRYVRQQQSLIPDTQAWLKAAVIPDERSRFKAYRQLLRQLPDDSRATLNALFGHFYTVQVFSQVNKMSAQNLALVLVPSLFQAMSQDLVKLTREFIIHHTLLFLKPEEEEEEKEEITVL